MSHSTTQDDAYNKRLHEIKSLRDKANQLASMHSWLSDRYRKWHTVLSTLLLLVSTLLLGFTFISEEFVYRTIHLNADSQKWIIGLTSTLNFAGVLLISQLDYQAKSASHREAVRFYFSIVNKIRSWLDSGQEITLKMAEEIRDEYSRTQSLPKIPDDKFFQLKQWHLQKIAISQELDKTPFKAIKDIRRTLSKSPMPKDCSEKKAKNSP